MVHPGGGSVGFVADPDEPKDTEITEAAEHEEPNGWAENDAYSDE